MITFSHAYLIVDFVLDSHNYPAMMQALEINFYNTTCPQYVCMSSWEEARLVCQTDWTTISLPDRLDRG